MAFVAIWPVMGRVLFASCKAPCCALSEKMGDGSSFCVSLLCALCGAI